MGLGAYGAHGMNDSPSAILKLTRIDRGLSVVYLLLLRRILKIAVKPFGVARR